MLKTTFHTDLSEQYLLQMHTFHMTLIIHEF